MIGGNLVLLGDAVVWVAPVWVLSVGVLLGLLVLLALYGLLWLVARNIAREVPSMLNEGAHQFLLYFVLVVSLLAVSCSILMPIDRLKSSIGRILLVNDVHTEVEIPPVTESYSVPIEFVSQEIQSLEISSDQDLLILPQSDTQGLDFAIRVQAGEPLVWAKQISKAEVPFSGHVNELKVTNYSQAPAKLTLNLNVDVEYPEVYSIPIAALFTVLVFLIYFGLRVAAPRLSAIASATAKQAVSQPVFLLAIAVGAFALLFFIYLPYNTFGEDVKMLKDSGLTLIMLLSVVVAVWTASVSVAEEIEGRTALTVLSKPVGRPQFIIGKFLGIVWPTVLLFLVLGLVFLFTVSYKVVYDAAESSKDVPSWQDCYLEMIQIVPGLALALMETVVLTAISVAISTRLSMLPNLIICASVYVLGHLVPLIVNSSAGQFQIVQFVGRLLATVFPVLDHFNIQAAVAAGKAVPLEYLSWALMYCVLYSTIMLLFALFLFEDRDLA